MAAGAGGRGRVEGHHERPRGGGTDEGEHFFGQRILGGKLRAPSELRPEVPFELDAMVLACVTPDPADRYPSAAAFAAEMAMRYDPAIGTPLAIASVVRGLFGTG